MNKKKHDWNLAPAGFQTIATVFGFLNARPQHVTGRYIDKSKKYPKRKLIIFLAVFFSVVASYEMHGNYYCSSPKIEVKVKCRCESHVVSNAKTSYTNKINSLMNFCMMFPYFLVRLHDLVWITTLTLYENSSEKKNTNTN